MLILYLWWQILASIILVICQIDKKLNRKYIKQNKTKYLDVNV